ncbi:thermonuclease family protein [Pseudonocardia sp. KRD291]|uniref:thermonuclease family protein n=1 Tax=Pseudonocardia sp. KRD291 TaxID=2792007 RepID=UPI001C4A0A81|nr:thermonuclease family protein [Pseudonocardia sp. KRD291]MBW0102876.1 thermonuclease family protein [Pseudonocardia sp. KRD291]
MHALARAVVALLTVGVAAGGLTACGSSDEPTRAVVTAHVDGDTFDVDLDGETTRIRLLNIDTPETKNPNQPVQCLGPEASAFVAGLIPVGTEVRLEYDAEREDPDGRTLAAAFTPDGRMVNAEIARAGLAQVLTVAGNERFRPVVDVAWQEAVDARRGLHSPDVACTYPGQARAVTETVAAAPTEAAQPAQAAATELSAAADRAGVARSVALTLLNKLANSRADLVWLALSPSEQTRIDTDVRAAEATAAREESALRTASGNTSAREAAERADAARAEAEQAEADRLAQEEAARAAEADASRSASEDAAGAPDAPAPSEDTATRPRSGQSGHPCLPGERDGDGDGFCGEGR